MAMPMRLVALPHAAAAGSAPRLNAFSAIQTQWNPFVSAAPASPRQERGSRAPCRRMLSFGSALMPPSYATRTRRRAGAREVSMHHAPGARFLAEYHRRAAHELLALIVNVLRRWLAAGPVATGAAMTPHNCQLSRDHPADVVGRPVTRLHVLAIEFPQREPM